MADPEHTVEIPDRSRPWFMILLRPAVTIPITLLLLIILACLATYRSARFRGIPPIDEVVDRETEGRIDVSDEENAFTYYGQAWERLPETLDDKAAGVAVDVLEAGGNWSDVTPAAKTALTSCEALLDDWKKGTECERGIRLQSADAKWYDVIGVQDSRAISRLVILKSAMLLHEGNTDEAWEWLRALFRFSRHLGNPGSSIERFLGACYHAAGSEILVHWAANDGVTSSQIETVIRELDVIYRLTARNSHVLKRGYLTSAKVLSEPESLEEYYFSVDIVPEQLESVSDSYLFLNGEPQLAELLIRHVYANCLSQCDLPRRDRVFATTRYPLFKPVGIAGRPLMDVHALDDALTRSRRVRSGRCLDFRGVSLIGESVGCVT